MTEPITSFRPRLDRLYRHCLSKIAYATKREAHAARRRVKAQLADELVVYACADCGGWHLGHASEHTA